ncbi:MAG: PAS domain S-box protein, partial [Candidatus Hadarchaeales archaeon]
MDVAALVFVFFAAVDSLLAVLCVYFAWKNSTLLKGAYAEYMISAGSILFVLSAVAPFIGYIFLTVIGGKYLAFFLFLAAFAVTLSGLVYSGVVVRKVKKIPWLTMLRAFEHGKYRLVGALSLLLALPFLILFLPASEVYPHGAVAQVLLSFGLGGIAFGERKLHSKIGGAILLPKEKLLLKDSVGLLRAYTELTNMFLSVIAKISGIKPVREIFIECSRDHNVFEDCEITERGRLDCSRLAPKVSKMGLEEAMEKLAPAFSLLNSRLIYLLGALTSPKFAEKKFSQIYYRVKEQAVGAEAFSRLAVGLPPGLLEDEKFRAASREELGEMVRERTAELEKTVAELKEAEWRLRESERRYRELVDLLPETVFEVGADGKLTFLNSTGQKEFGFSDREIAGMSISRLLAKRDQGRLKSLLRKPKTWEGEFTAVRKNGTKFPALIRCRPIVVDGKFIGVRGIIVNIEAMKKAEEAERIEILRRLEDIYRTWKKEKKIERVPPRVREMHMAALDTIKRQLFERAPYIIETYRELLKKK